MVKIVYTSEGKLHPLRYRREKFWLNALCVGLYFHVTGHDKPFYKNKTS